MRKRVSGRVVFSWALALAAFAFIAWVVPVRDRCSLPGIAGVGVRFPVDRIATGCILHAATGDLSLTPVECARLTCEPGLRSVLTDVSVPTLVALLGLYAVGVFAVSVRWKLLLGLAQVPISQRESWWLTIQGIAAGIILPAGGVGGDAIRVAGAAGRGVPLPVVIASVLLDRVIGLVALATLAALLGVVLAGGDLVGPLVILACFPAGFVAAIALFRLPAIGRLPLLSAGRLGKTIRPIVLYIAHPKALGPIARAFAVSLINSAMQLMVIRGALVALHTPPTDEKWVFVGAAMAFMVSAVPALPGGWGTSDAAFVFFLGRAGAPASAALAVCMLYRLFWYTTGGIGSLVYVAYARGGESKRAAIAVAGRRPDVGPAEDKP